MCVPNDDDGGSGGVLALGCKRHRWICIYFPLVGRPVFLQRSSCSLITTFVYPLHTPHLPNHKAEREYGGWRRGWLRNIFSYTYGSPVRERHNRERKTAELGVVGGIDPGLLILLSISFLSPCLLSLALMVLYPSLKSEIMVGYTMQNNMHLCRKREKRKQKT